MRKQNLFTAIPGNLSEEIFEPLVERRGVRIERIISSGQSSPAEGWYDQQQDEWVLLLQGTASIAFQAGEPVELWPGDYLDIPAHTRHRVVSTSSDPETIWLAIHY